MCFLPHLIGLILSSLSLPLSIFVSLSFVIYLHFLFTLLEARRLYCYIRTVYLLPEVLTVPSGSHNQLVVHTFRMSFCIDSGVRGDAHLAHPVTVTILWESLDIGRPCLIQHYQIAFSRREKAVYGCAKSPQVSDSNIIFLSRSWTMACLSGWLHAPSALFH